MILCVKIVWHFLSKKIVFFLYKFLKNIFIGLCIIEKFYVNLRLNKKIDKK